MRFNPAVSALALCAGLAPAIQAATLVNGSFEEFAGTVGGDGAAFIGAGSNALTGWEIVHQVALIQVPNDYALTASDGSRFLDLTSYNGTGAGAGQGVQQQVTGLLPGGSYRLSFDVGVNNGPCGTAGNNCLGPVSVRVQAGGASLDILHDPVGGGNVWSTYGLSFVAAASSTAVQITLLSVAGAYVGLDNVRVSAVPEPSAAWLLAAGLAGMAAWRRRQSA